MEKYCAQLDDSGVIINVIVCDDIEWVKTRMPGIWVFCDSELPAVGEVWQQPS